MFFSFQNSLISVESFLEQEPCSFARLPIFWTIEKSLPFTYKHHSLTKDLIFTVESYQLSDTTRADNNCGHCFGCYIEDQGINVQRINFQINSRKRSDQLNLNKGVKDLLPFQCITLSILPENRYNQYNWYIPSEFPNSSTINN